MHNTSPRRALLQAIVLFGGAAAIVATTAVRLHRPFDADTLEIPVGALRSNAAEAQLLLVQADRDHLAPAFVRYHARQLADTVQRTRGKLADKPALGDREPLRREALALADALDAQLDSVQRDARAATPDTFAALARALDALDHRIKPGA